MLSCARTRTAAATTTCLPAKFQISRRPTTTTTSPRNPSLQTHQSDPLFVGPEDTPSPNNRHYWSEKLRSLCDSHGGVDSALRLLDRLRLLGYRPTSPDLRLVVRALCDSGRPADACRRLLLSLSSGWLPDDRDADAVLSRLIDDPRLGLRALDALVAAKPAYVPSLSNYNRLLDALCTGSLRNEALRVLSDMGARGRSPDAASYTALIDGFCRVGELTKARDLFDEMTTRDIAPNPLTYTMLIKGVLRKRDFEESKALMGKLWENMREEKNPSINNAAFANLISALCKGGIFSEVFRIAEETPQTGSVCESFAYGEMIDSLCRAGHHHGASRIVYLMRKRGLLPSFVSYNYIVHGLSKNGGCMRAYQLFEEGTQFGYSPNEPTYKALVEGLCKEPDIDKAKKLTEFMLATPDKIESTRVYNIFLNALCVLGNPCELLNVLVSMLEKGCSPDVVTLNTVVHGFCKAGWVDEAVKVLNDMLSGKFCAPDVVTFTTAMGGLLNAGRVEEAMALLNERMREARCSPTVVTYNAVLKGLCELGKIDEAMEVFSAMCRERVPPDSMTYTSIIDGLFKAGRVEEAKRFWSEMVRPSGVHDEFVYSAIVRGLCASCGFDEAREFLRGLVDCGASPKIVSYNILVDCACEAGLKREAYWVVGEMRKNGLAPDAVTWRTLEKLRCVGLKSGAAEGAVDRSFVRVGSMGGGGGEGFGGPLSAMARRVFGLPAE
ncbi:Pentatricopeptide repeat-containing protein [Acorus gramineus]|uniref:Pentatricopeptide repeat-containing protein n=1 Tax=Acorus gramineus TaxID=55184 RepID=A0AAV9BI70_ACOGR|nr:Pentatricopeptide repeat-containing protein [Acorus gramineus]